MQTVFKCNNVILCTNIIAVIEKFVVLNKINYVCIASSQNRFVLPDLSIAINLSKCEKILCFYVRVKKYLMVAFMKMNNPWILVSLFTLLHLNLTLLR